MTYRAVQDPTDPHQFMVNERQLLRNVHDAAACAGRPCVMHNPSEHCMSDFPLWWRGDRKLMERTCPHGVGHPDPDQPFPPGSHEWRHGCDGCCRGGAA